MSNNVNMEAGLLQVGTEESRSRLAFGKSFIAAGAIAFASIGGNVLKADAKSPNSNEVELGGLAVECIFPNPNGSCNDHMLGGEPVPDHGNGNTGNNTPPANNQPSSNNNPPANNPPRNNNNNPSANNPPRNNNNSGGGGGANNSGNSNSNGNTYVAPRPQTFEQRVAGSPFAEDCSNDGEFSWTETEVGSLMFDQTLQAEGVANDSLEVLTPEQLGQALVEQLTANRGEDGGSWINKMVEQCALRPLTGQEFINWYGEEAAPAYDQHRIDFGYPVTTWEVMIDRKDTFNIDAGSAQLPLILEFQDERISTLVANIPSLDWDAYAAGQINLDGTPVAQG